MEGIQFENESAVISVVLTGTVGRGEEEMERPISPTRQVLPQKDIGYGHSSVDSEKRSFSWIARHVLTDYTSDKTENVKRWSSDLAQAELSNHVSANYNTNTDRKITHLNVKQARLSTPKFSQGYFGSNTSNQLGDPISKACKNTRMLNTRSKAKLGHLSSVLDHITPMMVVDERDSDNDSGGNLGGLRHSCPNRANIDSDLMIPWISDGISGHNQTLGVEITHHPENIGIKDHDELAIQSDFMMPVDPASEEEPERSGSNITHSTPGSNLNPDEIPIRSEFGDPVVDLRPVETDSDDSDACHSHSHALDSHSDTISISNPSAYLRLPENLIDQGDTILTGGRVILTLDAFIRNVLIAESRNPTSSLSCLSAINDWSATCHPLVTNQTFSSLLGFSATLKTLAIIYRLTIRDAAFLFTIHASTTKYLLNARSRRSVMVELLERDYDFIDYLSRLIEWELGPVNLEFPFSFDHSSLPPDFVEENALSQDELIKRFGFPDCLSKFIRSRGPNFVIVLYVKALFSPELAHEFQFQVNVLKWGFGISFSFATFICQQYRLNPDWNK
jgi:hypothetical protein